MKYTAYAERKELISPADYMNTMSFLDNNFLPGFEKRALYEGIASFEDYTNKHFTLEYQPTMWIIKSYTVKEEARKSVEFVINQRH